jgi:cystathionine beta-lyase/cystathionine gamma-synthase
VDISYIINELGEEREQYFHALAPPIFQTAMICSPTVAEMRRKIRQESEEPFYTRGHNPTGDILRRKLAALEGAEDCLLFASGSAAVAAGVMANLQSGDHIVSVSKPYSWTNKLFTTFLPRFGIRTTMVDGTNPQNFAQAIEPNTKLLFMESPNSWTYEMQDIAQVVALARQHQLWTMIDNSFATPLYQKPIDLGVDLVVHSATKYISGHSDTMAGVLCGSKAMLQKIFYGEYMTLGAMLAPFNAWLLLRGLRTLPIRLKQISATTAQVIDFLQNHPKIEKIYYPFLPQNPQLDLAHQQMQGASGLFTIQLKAKSIADIEAFCDSLQRFLLAVSWGGYESLVFPACSLVTSEDQPLNGLNWQMVRIAIGLEDSEVLITDLEQALARVPEV